MTGLKPDSAFPVSSDVFPKFYVGAGSYSKEDEGYAVTDATTLTADAIWRFRFEMPSVLPSGTGKLRIISIANATAGVLKINVKWASVAVGEDPSSMVLNDEGTVTITWSAGDADDYKGTKITLDADTLVASEFIKLDLVFEDTGMTLAVDSVHFISIIWE